MERPGALRTRVGKREFHVSGNEIIKGCTVGWPFEILELDDMDEVAGCDFTGVHIPHSRGVSA